VYDRREPQSGLQRESGKPEERPPAVSTLILVHHTEGGDYGQVQAETGKARRNYSGIREAHESASG
jgi:hypothetical protein